MSPVCACTGAGPAMPCARIAWCCKYARLYASLHICAQCKCTRHVSRMCAHRGRAGYALHKDCLMVQLCPLACVFVLAPVCWISKCAARRPVAFRWYFGVHPAPRSFREPSRIFCELARGYSFEVDLFARSRCEPSHLRGPARACFYLIPMDGPDLRGPIARPFHVLPLIVLFCMTLKASCAFRPHESRA